MEGKSGRHLYLVEGAGTSPSISANGGCSVVFSGRLAQSPSPSTEADVVRDIYLRGGEAGLRELRGTFALLLLDIERDHLIAARDPLGYHPLFFVEQNDQVLIGTSQDQLLAFGVSKNVDRAVALGWICDRSLDPRDTFFTEIKRLLPGHLLRVSGGGLSVRRYWSPSTAQRPGATDFERVHQEFDEILRRSVGRGLDLGQAGVCLSGGVDSATVAAVATDVSRERGLPDPVALSLRFPNPAADESAAQLEVARALGIRQLLVSFDEVFGVEGGVIKTLQTAPEVAEPPGSPWASAYDYLAVQAADRGCRVMLNGEWGEWMHAPREVAADLIRRLDLAALYALGESEHWYRSSGRKAARTILWKFGARLLMRQTAAAAVRRLGANRALYSWRRQRLLDWIPGWLAPDPRLRRELAERWAVTLPEPRSSDFYRRALAVALDSPETVVWMDHSQEYASRFGIEVAEPFHDPDLLEFLFQIPPDHLFFRGQVKALSRASIRSRLPDLAPATLGLAWPEQAFESMLAREGERGLELLGGLSALSGLEILVPGDPIKALTTGVFAQDVGYQIVWRALAMEAWLQSRL